MGFFGKLFDKKECDLCGGEIGLLGNRKLEDGNMCKHCASKLSPWFSDRRNSTVEEIEAQLRYREENHAALAGFAPVCRIGENDYFIAELQEGVPSRFVVCSSKDYMDENADLIGFRDVSCCNIDIDEDRTEQKRTNDKGEMVSFNPPRYTYNYDFYVKLHIENNPYFDEIRFKLNNFSVDVRPDAFRADFMGDGIRGIGRMIFGGAGFDPNAYPEYSKYAKMCDEIEMLVDAGRRGVRLDGGDGQVCEPQQDAAPNFCSNCGAPVSGGKFCANCGAKVGP